MSQPPRPHPKPWLTWLRAVAAGLALLAALAGSALLAGCALVDREQRYWIFQPGDRTWPGGLAAAEGMQDVWIEASPSLQEPGGENTRLHGLWLPQPHASAPLMLYLHGARWDVRASAPRMRRMHDMGFAVLGIDYRGFGRSTPGLPSETLAGEDARMAWDWLGRQHPGPPRYLYGHSLGAAIAVHLAADVKDEAGLIIEGSFPSTRAVLAASAWGWLPVSALITQTFDSASRIAHIGSPVLVVHGGSDTLILPSLGRSLFDSAIEPKRFLLIEGGAHHNTSAVGLQHYRQALGEFFGLPR